MEVVVSEAEETKVVLWTEEAAADIQAVTQELAEATRQDDVEIRDVANGTDALIAIPGRQDPGDLQSSLTRLVMGVVLTNLRLTQELVSISSPSAFAALQQRFALEYFKTFQKGIETILAATKPFSA